MPEPHKSQAPWVGDRSAWGRVRLTREMWRVSMIAINAYLQARWALHHELPNPSPDSRESMDEIRELQKIMANLEGLGEEKGWLSTSTGGSSGSTASATSPGPSPSTTPSQR